MSGVAHAVNDRMMVTVTATEPGRMNMIFIASQPCTCTSLVTPSAQCRRSISEYRYKHIGCFARDQLLTQRHALEPHARDTRKLLKRFVHCVAVAKRARIPRRAINEKHQRCARQSFVSGGKSLRVRRSAARLQRPKAVMRAHGRDQVCSVLQVRQLPAFGNLPKRLG